MFDEIVTKVIQREGGATITNDPDDAGGTTKYGISQKAYPNIDIANLTLEEAKAIYKRDYWDKIKGDEIADCAVAECFFDAVVNMGPSCIKWMQAIIGTTPDGAFGPKSIEKLNSCQGDEVVVKFTLRRISFYKSLCDKKPSQKKYFFGWVSRALEVGHA